jgi:2,3-bisphosphoglycerate-dependent phosphoglycerate mutase
MAYLILVRHGLTDWNKEGRWHGLTDIPLNKEGRRQSREAASLLKGFKIDSVYTSVLSRVTQTYDEICDALKLSCPIIKDSALNERDYGIYTGKNKWEVKKELGEEKFLNLRRSWNQPIKEGESLKDVYTRVVPFYKERILKDLTSGKNVLVISSGNTLRALIKHIENISDPDIVKLELGFAEVYVFEVDKEGKVIGKKVLNSKS